MDEPNTRFITESNLRAPSIFDLSIAARRTYRASPDLRGVPGRGFATTATTKSAKQGKPPAFAPLNRVGAADRSRGRACQCGVWRALAVQSGRASPPGPLRALLLANHAKEGRPAAARVAKDRPAAAGPPAGGALAVVDVKAVLEIAELAVRSAVIAQRRAAASIASTSTAWIAFASAPAALVGPPFALARSPAGRNGDSFARYSASHT